ncbi:MAG: RnfABCDGE type electron transport complex subunit G [Lachnospiraceae bacterium]|nr:RnfABCDGE type electron transport complex subunit G [Lachnospiraceae bacterium]
MKMFKDAFVLFLITIVAACALGAVYEITKGPIEDAAQKAKTEAYEKVFGDIPQMEELDENVLADVNGTINGQERLDGSKINEAYLVYDENGQTLGTIMSVTNSNGYGGDITIAMGVTKDGTLNGIEFLEISETAGLGMKAKEEKFLGQFRNVNTKSFSLLKAKIDGETEMDAVSSATITSKAVNRAVNAGLVAAEEIGNSYINAD